MCDTVVDVVTLSLLLVEQKLLLIKELSIPIEGMDITRSAPQGAHFNADVD